MTAFVAVLSCAMVACGLVGVVTAARMRRGRIGALVADAIMLVSMLDVCVFETRLVAPVAWAALLLIIALGSLVVGRGETPAGRLVVAMHALGLVVTAATLLVLGGMHAESGVVRAGHHGTPGILLVIVAVVATVHVAMAIHQLWTTDATRSHRAPAARVSAAAAGSSVMTTLALVTLA